MRRAISPDSSPALSVPFRFFLNAPVFALLAAGLLVWEGPDALASRWSPVSLALTHLFTLGILTSVMVGALIQILPVATGVRVAGTGASAVVVHTLLTAGTLALSSAFMAGMPALYAIALLLLASAFAWLLAACAIGFWRYRHAARKGVADVLCASRLALVALLVTIALGLLLAGAQAFGIPLPIVALTNLHAMWGLSGWVGLLTIGMAYQLIPMFVVTEPYPRVFAVALAPGVFALLALFSLSATMIPRIEASLGALLLVALTAFAVVTLRLLWMRKRPAADAITLFWRTAMLCLTGCGPLWAIHVKTGNPACAVALGVLLLFGVAWSLVNGMLYKIVPFLLWYHAQRTLTGAAMRFAPKVRDMIPDRAASMQFRVHLAALGLLLAASLRPMVFARMGGLGVGVSAAWLGLNMLGAVRIYLRVARKASSMQIRAS
ncbi:hypothetical protein [Paraburkholderia nodosa]|uniref:hypothetical protein n=1 Tax=Paraburkholderia nodosa TaxID=392320 RepID=UPI000480E24B|nr:hypothetical protein [Paraburkholderia nodosa]